MKKKILTVDDSHSVREMMRINLENGGYEVIQADCGEEALKLALQGGVDLVITDLNMGKMSGLELARRLRAEPDCRFLPIVLLTTENRPEFKAEGKKIGVNGWIVKPFKSSNQLLSAVRRLV